MPETKETKVTKEAMPSKNCVTMPRPDTLCGKVWALADSMSKAKGGPVAIADLLDNEASQGFNTGNVKAEYARWRKYYGVTGRILSEKAQAQQAEREAAKEAKAQAKVDAKAAKEAEKEAKRIAKEEKAAEAKAKKEAAAKAKAEAKAKKEADAKAKAEK